MAPWKTIARLGWGWLLMLAGMAMLLDSGMPTSQPRARGWLVAEALVGFALVAGGWIFRRASTSPRSPR